MIGNWDGVRENCKGWECISIGEKVHELCGKYSGRTAFIDDNGSVTYSELDSRIESLARGFYRNGLRKGDIVLFQIPNRISFAVKFFALQRIGCITVMLLPASREADIRSISALVDAKAYIYEADLMSKGFEEKAREIAKISGIPFYDEKYTSEMLGKEVTDEYDEREKPIYTDTALLLLSGGTTGTPKLIPRTHGDYLFCAQVTSKKCGWHDSIRSLGVLPSAHNFALGTPGIIGTLLYGGTNVLTEYSFPGDILSLIEERRIQAVSLVPVLVSGTADMFEAMGDTDISSLEAILVGGSVFTDVEAERVNRLFPDRLVQVYGMGEGLNCSTEHGMPINDIIQTQGTPSSEYDMVKFVDENMNEVPDGVSGQLITKGPYTITRYYGIESDSFHEGWYCTGDRGMITESGKIKMTGRTREMINRAGEKIIPSHIEEYLLMHTDIRCCAVAGKPDKLLGNAIAAFVVTDNKKLDLADIRTFLRSKGMAEYRMPDELYILESLPLTAVGKVDKKALISGIVSKEETYNDKS